MPSVVLNGDLLIVDSPVAGTPDATAGGFSAQDLRAMVQDGYNAPGPSSFGSFNPSVVSGTTVQTTTGTIKVRSPIDNSLYRAQQTGSAAQLTLTAPSTHQRIDRLIVRVYDQSIDSSGLYQATLETVAGAEDTTATLDNLASAADIHATLTGATAFCHIADVLITTGGVTTLRDRRPLGQRGMIPLLSPTATVPTRHSGFAPYGGLDVGTHTQDNGAGNLSSSQSAALMYLPFRGPFTNVKWAYQVDTASGGTPNFNIGIYDPSGWRIAQTGVTAWSTGTGYGSAMELTLALTVPYSGYVFENGAYYVVMGVGTGMGALKYTGVTVSVPGDGFQHFRPSATGLLFGSPSGGTTLPLFLTASGTTWLDFSHSAPGTGNNYINVPVITLST